MDSKNSRSDDREVILIDDTNSVRTGRRPASEGMRKSVRDRMEKDKKLLEVMEKMKEQPEDRKNGTPPDGDVTRNG